MKLSSQQLLLNVTFSHSPSANIDYSLNHVPFCWFCHEAAQIAVHNLQCFFS